MVDFFDISVKLSAYSRPRICVTTESNGKNRVVETSEETLFHNVDKEPQRHSFQNSAVVPHPLRHIQEPNDSNRILVVKPARFHLFLDSFEKIAGSSCQLALVMLRLGYKTICMVFDNVAEVAIRTVITFRFGTNSSISATTIGSLLRHSREPTLLRYQLLKMLKTPCGCVAFSFTASDFLCGVISQNAVRNFSTLVGW